MFQTRYSIIIFLTILVFVLPCPAILQSVKTVSATAQEFTPYYYALVMQHQRMDGSIPDDAVIFIGDSIIQGLAVSAVAGTAVNYGISGDTSAGVMKRLSSYHSLERARAIILHVGVNDLGVGDAEKLLENYRTILQKMPATRPVIVSAILPLDENIFGFFSGNARILVINKKLHALCAQFGQVEFVNGGETMVDSSGNLNPQYHVGDGIHLNTRGYKIFIEVLQSVLPPL